MRPIALTALIAGMIALSPVAQAMPDSRTQLERLIGLSPAEAGRYSDGQLALMKGIMERQDISETRRQYLIDEVRAGRKPRFFLFEF